MPKLEKGSQAAKDWAKKMRDARMSKKSVKGGVIGDDPFGLSRGGKKLSLNRVPTPVPPTPVLPTPTPEILSPPPNTDIIPVQQFETQPSQKIRKPKARRTPLNPTMPDLSAYDKMSDEELLKLLGKGLKGGYLQPGESPPAAGPIDYKEGSYVVEPDDALDEEMIDGEGMCTCCKMCGGKLSMKKIGKAFSKLGQATTKINPVSLALENKKSRDAMVKSGQFTQDVALPAVTTAGLPLYYGAAGTAGMMLGGPVGSMAATKAADELYKGMVVKPGYDPQERQKSKTVGLVAKKSGELGAKSLKQGASGKGVRKQKLVIIN
jgi:hypothetical protein